jgi:acetyltransferase
MTLGIRHVCARDGTPLLLRAVRPEDKPRLISFLKKIAPEDIRLKFFGATNFSDRIAERLSKPTTTNAVIFVLFAEQTSELVAFARLHRKAHTAEFAILVRSDLKNHGYGWLLMEALVEYARLQGISEIEGEVLANNANMLRMCREFGFAVSPCPNDARIRSVRLQLTRDNTTFATRPAGVVTTV